MSQFIWYDLMTSDAAKASAFYAKVVGWTIADSGMPDMDYNIISAGDTMIGGIMNQPKNAGAMNPPWHGHIYSEDVNEDCKRVTSIGGHVHQPPADIPGIGRFAVVSDPGEASFILFKPNSTEQPSPAPPQTRGHIGWRELHAWDGEKAMAFYAKLFGWSETSSMDMGPMGHYRLFTTDGESDKGGIMTKSGQMPQSQWVYYFNVEAADAAANRVVENGGKLAMGPMQVPGGQWALQAFDAQGKLFGLLAARR